MSKTNGKNITPLMRRNENWLGGQRARTQASKSAPKVAIMTRLVIDGVLQEAVFSDNVSDTLKLAPSDTSQYAVSIIAKPNKRIITDLNTAWELHPLLEEDLHQANQRPKVTRYGDILFLAVRAALYIDRIEEVEFSEFHLLVRGNHVFMICQDNRLIDGTVISPEIANLAGLPLGSKSKYLGDPELLKMGPEAFIYQMLDVLVDGYFPVFDGLQYDKDQIERQVFSGDTAATERIYRLSQETIDLLHTTTSLIRVLNGLRLGADKYEIAEELKRYLQDVSGQLTHVISETTELRDALSQILIVNSTLVTERQNEDMKKISGWAAIIFAPTLIASIYGMNFDFMPELHYVWGYPAAMGAMLLFTVGLYVFFKYRKWM